MSCILGVMIAWVIGVLAGPAAAGPSAALMALAAVALTGMVVAFLARGARLGAALTARPLTGRVTALCQKSWCAAFQRQLNPDAAGRAPAQSTLRGPGGRLTFRFS